MAQVYMIEQKYNCPVCGWAHLKRRPYKNMPDQMDEVLSAVPPYEDHWGMATYQVCLCCGYEFGFDDNPGDDQPGTSFREYLKTWFNNGQEWFHPKEKPQDYDILKQLEKAKIPVPDYIKVSRQLGAGHKG
jgi:rubredoxin